MIRKNKRKLKPHPVRLWVDTGDAAEIAVESGVFVSHRQLGKEDMLAVVEVLLGMIRDHRQQAFSLQIGQRANGVIMKFRIVVAEYFLKKMQKIFLKY